MVTRFKIIYAIRFFCGKLESGTIEFDSSAKTTKEDIQADAMAILRCHIHSSQKGTYSVDKWLENIQKIDLTVTQLL